MPLIVMLVLINIIAVICVGAPFGRPQENAEIGKDNIEINKEEILATTIQAGENYNVTETGIYKIELHGGNGESDKNGVVKKGSKVIGYVRLNAGDILTVEIQAGGSKDPDNGGAGGKGISLMRGSELLGWSSGGPGESVELQRYLCNSCGKDIERVRPALNLPNEVRKSSTGNAENRFNVKWWYA